MSSPARWGSGARRTWRRGGAPSARPPRASPTRSGYRRGRRPPGSVPGETPCSSARRRPRPREETGRSPRCLGRPTRSTGGGQLRFAPPEGGVSASRSRPTSSLELTRFVDTPSSGPKGGSPRCRRALGRTRWSTGVRDRTLRPIATRGAGQGATGQPGRGRRRATRGRPRRPVRSSETWMRPRSRRRIIA